MSSPAPSPPLPALNPPMTFPPAGHCHAMPATVRDLPGGMGPDGGAVVCGCAGAAVVAAAATVEAETAGAAAPAVEEAAGATPAAVTVCVITGPNTGAASGCADIEGGGDCVVTVVTFSPAKALAGAVAGADSPPSFSIWPGWIT